MQIDETPQDKSALEELTPELCYAKSKDGKYQTTLSSGWEPKSFALEQAWEDIEEELKHARVLVLNGEKSPVYYYMIKNLMDVSILASYMRFSKFKVKRHFKSKVFNNLKEDVLIKYAKLFDVSIEELRKI